MIEDEVWGGSWVCLGRGVCGWSRFITFDIGDWYFYFVFRNGERG